MRAPVCAVTGCTEAPTVSYAAVSLEGAEGRPEGYYGAVFACAAHTELVRAAFEMIKISTWQAYPTKETQP